jgi:hypothetical protein
MSLDLLKRKKVALPPIEIEDGIEGKQIMQKIKGFYYRLEKSRGDIQEFAESEFLQLLRDYPKSMLAYHMSDTLKLLISLFYYAWRTPEENPSKESSGLTMDDLSVVFDLSMASVQEAVKERGNEAKRLLEAQSSLERIQTS